MNIIKDFTPPSEECGGKTVATLGTFDGVHIGHSHILRQVVARAEETGGRPVILTFDRHPISVIKPEFSPKLLTTLDEKLAIIGEIGIETAFVLNFTRRIASLTAEEFIKEYLIDCLGMKHFIVGYDHGFGKDRSGTPEQLEASARKYNFTLEVIQPIIREGMVVKSSTLRDYLHEGRVEVVSSLLGTDYSFAGTVVKGRGLGKKIGFPTANIVLQNPEKILPSPGVYAGWTSGEGSTKESIITIGPRPTFGLKEEAVEVHIPGFTGDLYGKTLRIGFVRRIRDIEKFNSQESLQQQIKYDIETLYIRER